MLVNADGDLVWSLTSDQAKAYWGEPVKLDALSCCQVVTPNGSIWNSVWEYPLGSLEAGTYTLIGIDNITHTVNDGYHTFRDPVTGEPITPTPSIYHPGDPYEVHTTIVVE